MQLPCRNPSLVRIAALGEVPRDYQDVRLGRKLLQPGVHHPRGLDTEMHIPHGGEANTCLPVDVLRIAQGQDVRLVLHVVAGQEPAQDVGDRLAVLGRRHRSRDEHLPTDYRHADVQLVHVRSPGDRIPDAFDDVVGRLCPSSLRGHTGSPRAAAVTDRA